VVRRRRLAVVITGTHVIIFSEDAEATRAFFRDVLGLPNVDAHDGWLIFKLPPAELGVHPEGEFAPSGRHQLYIMCDNVEEQVEELKEKGVEFTSPIENQGFGLITTFRVPGGGEMCLYQPRHAVAYDL
jgi:catechol 2,3-dioxygenase-like lactoylglutathione lyase family enzyme